MGPTAVWTQMGPATSSRRKPPRTRKRARYDLFDGTRAAVVRPGVGCPVVRRWPATRPPGRSSASRRRATVAYSSGPRHAAGKRSRCDVEVGIAGDLAADGRGHHGLGPASGFTCCPSIRSPKPGLERKCSRPRYSETGENYPKDFTSPSIGCPYMTLCDVCFLAVAQLAVEVGCSGGPSTATLSPASLMAFSLA